MMKKENRWIILIVPILLFLSSCAPRQTLPPTPTPGVVSRPLQIEIWLPEQNNEFYARLAEDFERENPGTNIRFKEIPQPEYAPQIDQAVREKSGPDIALVSAPHMLLYRYFIPLEEMINQYHIPIADFNKGAMARACMINKRTYCLGTYTSAYILLYNPEILAEFGIPFPNSTQSFSINDYSNMVRIFKNSDPHRADSIWGSSFPLPYLWMDRRSLLSMDGRKIYRLVNDEPTINTYQALSDLCEINAVNCETIDEQATAETMQMFIQGKLATAIVESQVALPILESSPIRWGASFVPTEKQEDANWTTAWTDGFGVLATSQHQDEALRFLAFLGNRGSEIRAAMGDIPLNMKLANQWAGENKARQQVVKVVQAAQKDIYVPDFSGTTQFVQQAFHQMITNDNTAKETLDEVAPRMQTYLDHSWLEYDRINETSP
jgi:ABC-type glycerol-3-phosphate transport system substrate-binding protein